MMVLLILVNSTNVSSMLKTLGDLMLVQKDIHHSIVNVHSTLLTVQVLGIVMISTILPKTLSGIMIPIMMDLLIVKTTGEMNTAQNLNTSIVTVHTDHIDLIILN